MCSRRAKRVRDLGLQAVFRPTCLRALIMVSSAVKHARSMSYQRTAHQTRLAVIPTVCLILLTLAACSGPGTSSASAGGTSTGPTAPTSPTSTSQPTSSPPGTAAPSRSPTRSAPPATTVAPVPVESNPPGDIPDNLAFVKYVNRVGSYSFTHPEGWARTGRGSQVTFTDKLNGVTVDSVRASKAPTVASARSAEVARLQSSVPAFELGNISTVAVPGGHGVLIVFRRNSAADPVTGKVYRDEVEEYLVYSAGRLVRMDLYGPVGADNVDAYRTMSQSLSIQ